MNVNAKRITLEPQPGPQDDFLNTAAEIAIYGGAAGGGKSYALLLSPLAYKNFKEFGAVIFRRDFAQIFSEGALWDEAGKMYGQIRGAEIQRSMSRWVFRNPKGEIMSKVAFRHIGREDELSNWQGSQICEIAFDELTHFSKRTFVYMLSRNRSVCGVRPFIRATCNPDANSWVRDFISWWIDPDTGYAIKERSGIVRWMIQREEEFIFADTREELWERFDLRTREERMEPKSVTFISSSVYDNQRLISANPQYLANLKALPLVEREQLLHGNWNIKPAGGLYFKRTDADIVPAIPSGVTRWVRRWDLAATEVTQSNPDPDWTSGVLMGQLDDGKYIVADVQRGQWNASTVRRTVRNIAAQDEEMYGNVEVLLAQDPGQAGKEQAESYVTMLSGYDVQIQPESNSKVVRAEPLAAQWQVGNILLLAGKWNPAYLAEMENFPDGKHDDQVDASSGAFNWLSQKRWSWDIT